MPRYSYVIAFPVLVALCIGINIQRYPAVSAMLNGEMVESRWLGRSDIFNFNMNKAEAASYQGYHSDADTVADSRASREPIPLSDSRSTSASTSSSADRSVDATRSGYTSRYSSSYGSDSTGGSTSTSNDSSSSYFGGSSYGSGSNDRSSYSSNSYDSASDSYGDTGYDYGGSSYGTSSTSSMTTSNGTSPSSSSSPSPKNRYNSYDDEDEDASVEEEQDSWSSRYGGAAETSFRTDTPQPGYSSRYATGDNAATVSPAETSTGETLPAAISNVTNQIVSAITSTGTESSEHLTAKPLSVQEKHELRLSTPFSMTQSGTKDAGSGAYIPPDFLPRNAGETADRLQTPSATATVSISPVIFGTTTETTSTSDEDVDTEAESSEDDETETTPVD